MFARPGCLLVAAPLVELALLVQVGRWIGVLPTVGIVAATGLLGAWLVRSQGLRALTDLQRETAAGRVPAQSFIDGGAVLVGGLLLLTPGILSDLLGFALLFPPTRRPLQRRALDRILRGIRSGTVHVTFLDIGMPGAPPPPGEGGEERFTPRPRNGGRVAPPDDTDRSPRPGEIIQD
jgi:UPF0716 protein FxsA